MNRALDAYGAAIEAAHSSGWDVAGLAVGLLAVVAWFALS
jgi:hypothetical protein